MNTNNSLNQDILLDDFNSQNVNTFLNLGIASYVSNGGNVQFSEQAKNFLKQIIQEEMNKKEKHSIEDKKLLIQRIEMFNFIGNAKKSDLLAVASHIIFQIDLAKSRKITQETQNKTNNRFSDILNK